MIHSPPTPATPPSSRAQGTPFNGILVKGLGESNYK